MAGVSCCGYRNGHHRPGCGRAAARPPCRHCGANPVNRPRGLCWKCFYAPGVRELYPSTSKHARRGVGNGNAAGVAPADPCPHPPGSAARERTLSDRAARGESLFHPLDADWSAWDGYGETPPEEGA